MWKNEVNNKNVLKNKRKLMYNKRENTMPFEYVCTNVGGLSKSPLRNGTSTPCICVLRRYKF